jgi:hypothetical protein
MDQSRGDGGVDNAQYVAERDCADTICCDFTHLKSNNCLLIIGDKT